MNLISESGSPLSDSGRCGVIIGGVTYAWGAGVNATSARGHATGEIPRNGGSWSEL